MSLYYVAANDIPPSSMTDKCIVLDLDQTLIATQNKIGSLKKMGIMKDPKLMALRNRTYYLTIEDLEAKGDGTKYDFWGITRPHVEEFLIFCFSYFKVVAVWSAGDRLYVEAIVDHIFRRIKYPNIIYSADDTIWTEDKDPEKPLVKICEELKQYMNLSNTIIVDDNISNFTPNPENGILIPAYEPPLNGDAMMRDEHSLLQIKYWLLQPEVHDSKDVRKLNKKDIFKTSVETYKTKLMPVQGYRFT